MKDVIQFNHISKSLSEEKVEELRVLYYNYHKLTVCHKWKYKQLKRINNGLQVTSLSLSAIGAAVAVVNPLTTIITGAGVLLGAWISKSNLSNKVEKSRFAYTTYEKVLHQIKGIMRSGNFDGTTENCLLSDLVLLDGIVTDVCPTIDKLFEKYSKKYQ